MKKFMLCLALVAGVFSVNLGSESFSAASNCYAQEAAAPVTIKPTMQIDYLVFAANALKTIEIKGNEVDAFLVCQQTINAEIQKCVDAKKRTDETHTFEIRLDVAQTTVNLLERATLTGADAVRYKGFVASLVEAGKKLQAK
ncbi:MAG: hypothetical protein PHV24_01990 [Candidatus Kapabacteria bacterium]|nr:hypothetical protein [Candidatus Kapabacteria bacterium]